MKKATRIEAHDRGMLIINDDNGECWLADKYNKNGLGGDVVEFQLPNGSIVVARGPWCVDYEWMTTKGKDDGTN